MASIMASTSTFADGDCKDIHIIVSITGANAAIPLKITYPDLAARICSQIKSKLENQLQGSVCLRLFVDYSPIIQYVSTQVGDCPDNSTTSHQTAVTSTNYTHILNFEVDALEAISDIIPAKTTCNIIASVIKGALDNSNSTKVFCSRYSEPSMVIGSPIIVDPDQPIVPAAQLLPWSISDEGIIPSLRSKL